MVSGSDLILKKLKKFTEVQLCIAINKSNRSSHQTTSQNERENCAVQHFILSKVASFASNNLLNTVFRVHDFQTFSPAISLFSAITKKRKNLLVCTRSGNEAQQSVCFLSLLNFQCYLKNLHSSGIIFLISELTKLSC